MSLLEITSSKNYIIRHGVSAFWLCLMTFAFILVVANQPERIDDKRVTGIDAIAGPLLLIVAGRFVIGIGQLSRRRFMEGRPLLGVVFALLTVLASGGLIVLSWVIVTALLFTLLYRQ